MRIASSGPVRRGWWPSCASRRRAHRSRASTSIKRRGKAFDARPEPIYERRRGGGVAGENPRRRAGSPSARPAKAVAPATWCSSRWALPIATTAAPTCARGEVGRSPDRDVAERFTLVVQPEHRPVGDRGPHAGGIARGPGGGFDVVSQPRVPQGGRSDRRLLRPDRIGGIRLAESSAPGGIIAELYSPFVRRPKAPCSFMDPRSAELTKVRRERDSGEPDLLHERRGDSLPNGLGGRGLRVEKRMGRTSGSAISSCPGLRVRRELLPKDVNALNRHRPQPRLDFTLLSAVDGGERAQNRCSPRRPGRSFGSLRGRSSRCGARLQAQDGDPAARAGARAHRRAAGDGATVSAPRPRGGDNASADLRERVQFPSPILSGGGRRGRGCCPGHRVERVPQPDCRRVQAALKRRSSSTAATS